MTDTAILEERIKLLESVLKQIKDVVNSQPIILVNIDIEAGSVGREVRLYTKDGTATGIGTKIVVKEVNNDLFKKSHATYEVAINLKNIIEGK